MASTPVHRNFNQRRVYSRLPMSKSVKRAAGPQRIPPAEAPADAVERLVSRKSVVLQAGDVVIIRDALPSLRKTPTNRWRYRLVQHFSVKAHRSFDTFQHAALEGELLAGRLGARLIYIEDDVPALLNDYRKAR
jgi:hypothetical protein